MPVRSFEDVDGGDAKGLFGLADLPVLEPAVAFQVVAEPADLIRQRFVDTWRERKRRTHRTTCGAVLSRANW